ncbi:MAG: sterol desaturase family protein [Acidobacteriia bacterium]|nr:sterol desaturase family protein [Terriglobia bacterium]
MNAQAIPSLVARFRAEYRAAEIPPSYSGILHFLFTSTTALAVIGLSLGRLHSITPVEWSVIPLTFLYANLVEYMGHKGPMHRPVRLLRTLFVRHTLQHHRFFTHEAMAYEGTQDYKMVLFPPVMILFFVGLHAVPVGVLLYYLTTSNVAYLFVATAIGYFLTYEWLHFAYHLREDSLPGRLPLMKTLRRLHTEHHDPALMSNYNFNITFPIGDYLFGTRYKP